MQNMIAYCGLVCSNCPTYLATINDDDEARAKTAMLYSERFGLTFSPDEINCDGCLSESGNMIGYCKFCELRTCCRKKGLENCSVCNEQPCENLTKFHGISPEAKAGFDSLKS